MRKLVFTLLTIVALYACGNKKKQTTDKAIVLADTAKFYPANSFINEQIKYVDLRNFTITKKLTTLSILDSGSISKDQFIEFALPFLQKTAEFTKQKNLFKESVFEDLGTESYTLNYTALSKTTNILSIDILLSEQTNLVKRLFIREQLWVNDTLIIKQYSWVADRRFQISESKKKGEFNSKNKLEVEWKN